MSHQLRAQRVWPCNMLARYIWQYLSILEDINELTLASQRATDERAKIALVRYTLVALHAFDDLAKRFQSDVRSGAVDELAHRDLNRLDGSIREYHRAIEPYRADLAAVRNTLGGHRGLPGRREQQRFKTDFAAWGEWEQTLASLEAKCKLEQWMPAIAIAFDLYNQVVQINAARWYWIEQKGRIRMYMPLRFADD